MGARNTTAERVRSFAVGVAHEFRAPTRAIEGFATLLQEDLARVLDDDAAHYLARIVSSARGLNRLLDDFLDYTRILTSSPSLSPLNVDKLLKAILARAKTDDRTAGAGISLDGRCPPVLADERLLVVALWEVVVNAAMYVPDGEAAHVRIQSDAVGGRARVCVTDDGIGIAPEHQQRVFGLFERLHGIEHYPGKGIGLSRAQAAMEKVGGDIALASGLGEGTTITLSLELA